MQRIQIQIQIERKTIIADISDLKKSETMASFNYTSTQHSSAYPAIDASSPELSQAGRAVLITGASFGLGFAAMQGFARASASRIILLGRRPDALVSACERLRAQNPSFQGELITYSCDIGDESRVAEVWGDLNQKAIAVDVMILSAIDPGAEGNLDALPLQRIWKMYEVNVRGNLDMTQRFVQQGKTANFGGRKVRGTVSVKPFDLKMLIHNREL